MDELKNADIYEAMIRRMSENVRENHASETDYINQKDGLLYCGKCHTPKQTVQQFFFGKMKLNCLCECQQRECEETESRKEEEERRSETQNRRRQCFDGSRLESCTFATCEGQSEAITVAKRFADSFPEILKAGKGLLLYGGVGKGKTFLAACIANQLIDNGYTARLLTMPQIRNLSADFDGKEEFFANLNCVSLLVIDDMFAESKTEYMQELLFNVVDGRINSGLPLIVTTNKDISKAPADLREARIYSRIIGNCLPVLVTGTDRRHEKDSLAEMRKILGV